MNESIVTTYPSHSAAEAAINALRRSGFDMTKLSIVGRDDYTDETGSRTAGDRMKLWRETEAFWGGLWGLLLGSAFFWAPGLGPLQVAGPLVTLIVAALEGAFAVGGVSAIGAALRSIGIPQESLIEYDTALMTGNFVMVAHGPEITHAKAILTHHLPG
jgi:hypothetical protein